MYQLYLEIPIPLRIAYFLWAVFVGLYWYASLHDKYHSKLTTGKRVSRNFNEIFILLAVSFVLINQFAIWFDIDIAKYISESQVLKIVTDKDIKLSNVLTSSSLIFWIGGFFMLLGLYIAATARAALNGYWTPYIMDYDSNDKRIIDFGIYSKMRHPIYVSQVLLALGTAFLSNSWVVLMFPIILAKINFSRAKKEEKYLLRHYAKGKTTDTNYKEYSLAVSACGFKIL